MIGDKKIGNSFDEISGYAELDDELTLEETLELNKTVSAKALADKAGLTTTMLRKHHEIYGYKKTGILNLMGSWLVNLPIFKYYYLNDLKDELHYKVDDLPGNISDLKELLKLKGVYRLKDITELKLLPFPEYKISSFVRDELKKDGANPSEVRKKYGIWKGINENCYLVHMPTFVKWFESLWKQVK